MNTAWEVELSKRSKASGGASNNIHFLNRIVLALALVFEGVQPGTSPMAHFQKQRNQWTTLRQCRGGIDPTLLVVLFDRIASLIIGLLRRVLALGWLMKPKDY